MTTYTATFRADIAFAMADIEADTAEEALQLARARAESDPDALSWASYDPGRIVPDEIDITGPDGSAGWKSEDFTLRLAAGDLLSALHMALEALNTAPRFRVRHLDTDSYQIASMCSAAIKEAEGE